MSVLPATPPAWLAPLRARWTALAPRERRSVLVAAVAVGLALTWLVAIAPALATLRAAPVEHAKLDAQLDEMRNLAHEAQSLRAAPPVPPAQAEAALRAATARLGEGARLDLQADRATLSFTGVAGPAFTAWLAEVRAGARARPVQAQVQQEPARAAAAGTPPPVPTYTGTVVLTLPRPNP